MVYMLIALLLPDIIESMLYISKYRHKIDRLLNKNNLNSKQLFVLLNSEELFKLPLTTIS